ncbi:hypothetical protein BKA67DRAFT_567705 [Truncatella angustata]|uniref:Uncharacterized protein n=1 Tax=Truncatella angustata TaxID=152316 RepID=A0A9P8ZWA4_9PEZI|nr:uncharacterized protein BKA67DRAFT_567705 [Truncatella angustata]KAH6652846.1 hypothetical protein BKA67DRAFT_567705 [Truncatella angustata]
MDSAHSPPKPATDPRHPLDFVTLDKNIHSGLVSGDIKIGSKFLFLPPLEHQLAAPFTIRASSSAEPRHLASRPALINLKHPVPYAPLAVVKDDRTKTQFVQIARLFIHFERCLAEFFQSFGILFQSSSNVQDINIGGFGSFCAGASEAWPSSSVKKANKEDRPVFSDDDEYLHYLQQGHEILYWRIVIDMFNELQKDMLTDTHAATMLHLIMSTFAVASSKRQKLLQTLKTEDSSTTDISLIVDGIVRRLDYLKGILRAKIPDPSDVDLLLAVTTVQRVKIDGSGDENAAVIEQLISSNL